MDLDKLLYLQGVGNSFVDCDGIYHEIPLEDRVNLLRTMCGKQLAQYEQSAAEDGFATWVDARIDELDAAPWRSLLRAFQWTSAQQPLLTFQVPADYVGELLLQFNDEHNGAVTLQFNVQAAAVCGDYFTDNQYYVSRQYPLADLFADAGLTCPNAGYHRLSLAYADTSESHAEGLLVIAPEQVYGADLTAIAPSCRPWGISLQLFSLWQPAMSGNIPTAIADFSVLADTVTLFAEQGADFLLLNPLHALPLHSPEEASPYSPYDRRRINPLYISLAMTEEGKTDAWRQHLPKRMPKTDSGTEWIDYTAAAKVKAAELKAIYKVFCGYDKAAQRRIAFNEFVAEHGDALLKYAEQQAAQAVAPWLKNSEFYLYLQFVAEEQLAACQQLALQRGMKIGLVRDMAVGAVGGGVEVAQAGEQFCTQASIGAPPDPFAPQGQNWGLTPLDPVGLKQHNFEHFIDLLRSNMCHCGALRIDHFMGLFRIWWWPIAAAGAPQPGGSYIYYPFDAMMAILRLESHRAHCMVIGEDLGIVPPEIKQPMVAAGIYSNELFYFCTDDYHFSQYAGYKHPNDYKYHSLMMLANHDVPTMAAWWTGKDLTMRDQLGLLKEGELAQLQQRRETQRQGVLRWLAEIAQCDVSDTHFTHLLPRWAGAVAAGQSQLYSVSLADLLAEEDAINIPGTSTEYPNWRRRYSQSVTALSQNELLNRVLAEIRSARRTQN
ncbi:4-alpha-glucanotransferase [Shewanella avicenniae]|uniref:4-alpha-glucanotransferase n=1 Tax=Shewanella avicenniae TaxID=2814294 RepID=A0ABX7QQ83_9GAMM|nr:4-alpha-glucanotransferase [Shewanella avicenniae]QSX32873.1 4-alpha-glucanotransferase [Shewanella avicenniae]